MEEELQKSNGSDNEINAYRILLERHLNDDRLMAERSSIFLASSSILFIGFVMLPASACILRIIVSCLGILLSFLAIISNRRTSKGLDFWDKGEKKIEKEGKSFAYMREKGITPYFVYSKGLRNRYIYSYIIPAIFIALWISSLLWVVWFN